LTVVFDGVSMAHDAKNPKFGNELRLMICESLRFDNVRIDIRPDDAHDSAWCSPFAIGIVDKLIPKRTTAIRSPKRWFD
jgi:hypothetical protein